VLNISAGSLTVLIVVLVGLGLIVRYCFGKEDGSVIFQGSSWVFDFPYQSDRAKQDIYTVVNEVFAARQARNGYPIPRQELPFPPNL
jgi:hypothetical protein